MLYDEGAWDDEFTPKPGVFVHMQDSLEDIDEDDILLVFRLRLLIKSTSDLDL